MFNSILIANRGEIACRIIRSCRRLGIASIAVYSDADDEALHVRMADRSVRIGASAATASYLNTDAIMNAASVTGAEAVHPGYGFLSERTELAQACLSSNVGWIGPSTRCIELMGSKLEAKTLAQRHGVSCLPGYNGADQSLSRLRDEADRIGYPLLIKASAGGGGRGMRKVLTSEGLASALESARKEAAAAFGDDRVLLERLLLRPRHLEVQLVGDRRGGLIHLYERECSVQRNYQKVVEEAPAPNLHPKVRERLLDSAIKLGRAIDYDSLGTVEFLLDADDARGAMAEPYFLEMNTRLQVEHPVTELLTGRDLVELQIHVATGEALGFCQQEVTASGCAIEARVCAEAPDADYTPCTGTILLYREPPMQAGSELEGVRCDSGVTIGSEVTPYYDSMLSKLIAWAPQRATAVARLHAALGGYCIAGVGSNVAFLRDILGHPRFRAGELSTDFLPQAFPDGWQTPALNGDWYAAAAVCAIECEERRAQDLCSPPWSDLPGFRITSRAGGVGRAFLSVSQYGGKPTEVLLRCASGGERRLEVGDRSYRWRRDTSTAELRLESRSVTRCFRTAEGSDGRLYIWCDGNQAAFTVTSQAAAAVVQSQASAQVLGDALPSPMPGLIAKVHVAVGDHVKRGDPVVTLEAMKLMQTLEALRDGIVQTIPSAGATVAKGEILVAFLPVPELATKEG